MVCGAYIVGGEWRVRKQLVFDTIMNGVIKTNKRRTTTRKKCKKKLGRRRKKNKCEQKSMANNTKTVQQQQQQQLQRVLASLEIRFQLLPLTKQIKETITS